MASFDNSLDNIGKKGSFVGVGLGWSQASAGPLDYFKLTTGEGGVRTPLIIAGPGIPSGTLRQSFSYVTDIMPTLLQYAGVDHPQVFEGRDVESMSGRTLVPVITGEEKVTYKGNHFIGAEMAGDKWIRKGDFKALYVSNVGLGFGPGKWQLFNVVSDPGETKDLASSMSELLLELKSAWKTYADNVGVVPPK